MVSSFQGWIIEICIFQVLSVKTCSLFYTLVDNLFLEKHMYIQLFKSHGLDTSQIIRDHDRLTLTTQAQARQVIFETVLKHIWGHSVIM